MMRRERDIKAKSKNTEPLKLREMKSKVIEKDFLLIDFNRITFSV